MDKQALKDLLMSIADNNFAVSADLSPYELSLTMMDYIGDPDSALRDELIYSILARWINDGVLTQSEIYALLLIAIDENHLMKELGAYNDTVFFRTFSVLVIACIICSHREANFISESDIQHAFKSVLLFYHEDNDVRGYVEGKGWAHGAAHGADALDEFARCEEIKYEGLIEILNVIHKKVNVKNYGYIHFEDERMITAVIAVLERQIIPENEINDWIKRFSKLDKTGVYAADYVSEFNVTVFLKSLYFRLIDRPEYLQFEAVIKDTLKEISRFK